jgi:2-methylfumaryl-CoA isomerase
VSTGAPLDGLTVLEVSSFVAAPLGGLTLAQLGADVIRIDPVGGGGDLGRWPLAPSGTSLYWTSLNKGKRSVTLNFRDAEGLARDFRTAGGERVMVVALTRRHFGELAAVTGLAGTFAELERLLGADFGQDGDRYRHREVIAALLEPWFAGRTVAEIERDLAGTSVLWSRYRRFTDLALAGNPLLGEITQPGVGPLLAPGSPLVMDGTTGPRPAPPLGADTAAVLTGLLGLAAAEIRALADRGIIGGS